jgi:hypothetical protein
MRLFSILLLSILFVAGCTRAAEQQAEVSGKVTYNGKPLPGGKVTFVSANGYAGHGTISPQGEYSVMSPLGEVRIGVDNTMLRSDPQWEKNKNKGHLPIPKAKTGEAQETQTKSAGASGTKQWVTGRQGVVGTYIHIPGRYADPTLSGLKFTVTSGSQTHNIELTDAPAPPPGS